MTVATAKKATSKAKDAKDEAPAPVKKPELSANGQPLEQVELTGHFTWENVAHVPGDVIKVPADVAAQLRRSGYAESSGDDGNAVGVEPGAE